jgi:phosphoribosylformimino-5-aminoimidazole carboxamide ribotide isomerase
VILYPAIDILDGKCVRLTQGQFDQAKVYFEDPLDAAKKWADSGAQWLHVVDLNGAKEGKPVNVAPIERIMTSIDLPVQIGGGIRSQDVAEIFLTMGAGRIIIGSAAIEDPDLVQILTVKYEERVGVSLDAKDGRVAIHGWQEVSDKDAIEVAQHFEGMGLQHLIYTDISKDGMMTGPNWDGLKKMIDAVSVHIVASGGISSLEDVKKAKELGAGGCILGRALYEEKIDLKEALALC